MSERGSIAFADDFRGDIFLIFLTPRDDNRGRDFRVFSPIKVSACGYCLGLDYCPKPSLITEMEMLSYGLTFKLASVICYKLISFHLQQVQARLEKKRLTVTKWVKGHKIGKRG